jgi:hypothetical protein
LNLALVSSDKTVRETTKRPHTLEAYVRVVKTAHRLGFRIVSYQILGLPHESLASMMQTLAFNARLPVLLGASPFYRTPNAPIARGVELSESDFVRARLTALAIETGHFQRDDIYTLLVTTRILNFLKGLTLARAMTLAELLQHPFADRRTRHGVELLEHLLCTDRLYFSTRSGLIANRHFRHQLFRQVMASAGQVACQNGHSIDVRGIGCHVATSAQPAGSVCETTGIGSVDQLVRS